MKNRLIRVLFGIIWLIICFFLLLLGWNYIGPNTTPDYGTELLDTNY